jgi:hypothetical protein
MVLVLFLQEPLPAVLMKSDVSPGRRNRPVPRQPHFDRGEKSSDRSPQSKSLRFSPGRLVGPTSLAISQGPKTPAEHIKIIGVRLDLLRRGRMVQLDRRLVLVRL